MPTYQQRWGYKNQQQGFSAPDVTPQTYPVGWQQQSKWRRKYTQQQSSPVPPVVVTILPAQITVAALAPTVVIQGPGWSQQSKWRRRTQQLGNPPAPQGPPLIVTLNVAQVTVAALAPTVVIQGPGWSQQSKWRRKFTQQQSALSIVNVYLTTAQITVNTPVPTVVITTPPALQGILPQSRWGHRGQQATVTTTPPPFTVNLPTAQVNVTAYPVFIAYEAIGWVQQSKWRRRTQQRSISSIRPPTVGGVGSAGLIKVTYSDPTTWTMSHSLAGAVQTDSLGNQLAVGFQGPISVQTPGSSPSMVESWHQPSLLTGAASGNGVNGFFYRMVSESEVEVLWDLTFTGTGAGLAFFIMPLLYQPLTSQNLECGWYGTGPAVYSATFNPYFAILGNSGAPKGRCSIQNIPNALTLSVFGRQKYSLDK
jgi:hypothetical protein